MLWRGHSVAAAAADLESAASLFVHRLRLRHPEAFCRT
jgi:hypothetical protein